MATCAISGAVVDASETAVGNVVVKFVVTTPYANGSATNWFIPKEVSVTTSTLTGAWTMTLSQGLSGIMSFDYPPNSTDSARRIQYAIVVPATPTASFNTLATEL